MLLFLLSKNYFRRNDDVISCAGLAICKFKTQEGDRTKRFAIASVYYFIFKIKFYFYS